jgi:1,4-dihydroxy-6-naphthoate synthase
MTVGFSPCPNDTFIFERFLQTDFQNEIQFNAVMADVEELNRKAFREELDITKLSFHAWLYLQDKYDLLQSGSALGKGCGPLLIAKKHFNENEIQDLNIAIPGKYTTANFLLQSRFPQIKNTQPLLFSSIENAILNNEVDAGVIIHENRFTYQDKGLIKLVDLGEWWENETNCPIPLGGIFIHKKHGAVLKQKVESLLKQSIEWAYAKKPFISAYIKINAQEMNEEVMKKHIDLYVNNFSIDLGAEGNNAINKMQDYFSKLHTN